MIATHNWWRINDLIDGMMFKWMNQIDSDDYKFMRICRIGLAEL